MLSENHTTSDVAVIMPAFEAEDTIARALESIAAQTVLPREVVVVDDGSADKTVSIAQSMEPNLQGIRLIVVGQEHAGPGAARNRAIMESRASVLAFLDADDDWLPQHLEMSLSQMNKSGCIMTAHNEWLVRDGEETLNDSVSRLRERTSPFLALYCKGCISTSTVLVKREKVIASGGFDPFLANGQDVDLWLSILSDEENKLAAFETPLSRYYIREGSIDSHISRRFHYHRLIALRWAGTAVRHDAGGIGVLWFRILAIHHAALQSHYASRSYGRLIVTLIRVPFDIITISLKAAFSKPWKRPDYI